jgi:rare lipoprotein A (peptidoglycan hydrolase)
LRSAGRFRGFGSKINRDSIPLYGTAVAQFESTFTVLLARSGCVSSEVPMRIRARDSIFIGIAILLTSFASGCTQSTSSQPPIPTAAIAPAPPPVAPPKSAPAQTVKASYYGDEFRGHRTASGERYDPNQLTAASKRLPIGSLVHVTNPENGRSVVVRINDHGPYVRGRSLDLSKAAARRIGLTKKGVARVKIARLHARPKSETAALPEEAKAAEPAVAPAAVQPKPTEVAASPSQPAKSEIATAHAATPASESGTADAATAPPQPAESGAAVQ